MDDLDTFFATTLRYARGLLPGGPSQPSRTPDPEASLSVSEVINPCHLCLLVELRQRAQLLALYRGSPAGCPFRPCPAALSSTDRCAAMVSHRVLGREPSSCFGHENALRRLRIALQCLSKKASTER